MAKNIHLRDGFARAAAVLDSVLDVAVGSLASPQSSNIVLKDLAELVTPELNCNVPERVALCKSSGLQISRAPSFVKVPGYSMGVLRESVEKGASARANTIPQDTLWSIAGAHVAGSSCQRMRAKKVAHWIHSTFLLAGGRINSDMSSLGMLWTMVAIGLRSEAISKQTGVNSLEKTAIKFSKQHQTMSVIDQFVCCEMARALKFTENLPKEHPLATLPLGAAPRYTLGYRSTKANGDTEPQRTFRQVPEDLKPYIFTSIKA